MNLVDLNSMELIGRIQSLERQMGAVAEVQTEQVTTLQTVADAAAGQILAGHQNFIRNGDLDWDRNRYIYTSDFAGGTGEDGNVTLEAAHVFAHPKDTAIETTGSVGAASTALTIDTPDFVAGDNGVEITVYGAGVAGADLSTTINGVPGSTTTCVLLVAATTAVTNARVRFRLLQLQEDSTDVDADANLATNTTVKMPAHTRYGSTVNDPDYERTNGYLRWSDEGNMLTFPLPYNNITPSKQYIVTFLYKLSAAVGSDDNVFADFFAGIWDNTSGQRMFLEGQPPAITATVNGTPGATSRDYFVVMYLADGRTIGSEVETVTNTAATINSTDYVHLSWPQSAGVVRSEVYRKTGATYERLGFPYPANSFFDRGTVQNTVGGFPATTLTRFTAFTQVVEANFTKASVSTWRFGQISILVPDDYDSSKTTGNQWLCIGMKNGFGGSARELLIDRFSMDDKSGVFTKCPLDFQAKRNVSTAAISGDQGDTGDGGGDIEPGGGGGCPTFDQMIETDHGELRAIDLIDKEHEYKIINRVGIPVEYVAEIQKPQQIYTLIAGEYSLSGSETHPVFTSDTDLFGKPLYRFTKNDIIYTKSGDRSVDQLVRHFKRRHTIKISLKGKEKGFWQNGIAVHNEKPVV